MMPEQAALVRKARDSVRAARLLHNGNLYDFAISRAYYAMFYVAEALLLGEGLAFSKHSAVIAAFGQHFSKPGRVPSHLHRYLIDGEEKRVKSDYDTVTESTDADADDQINHAQEFLDMAEQLIGPLPPAS
jgi:uncharacterized protein (UPF0332 family)